MPIESKCCSHPSPPKGPPGSNATLGFVIQHGVLNPVPGQSGTITFPTPFASRATVVLTPEYYDGVLANCVVQYSSSSQGAESFNYVCYGITSGTNGSIFYYVPNAIWWIAIGPPVA